MGKQRDGWRGKTEELLGNRQGGVAIPLAAKVEVLGQHQLVATF